MIHLLLFSLWINIPSLSIAAQDMAGAWETNLPDGSKGLLIITDDYFSISYYHLNSPGFKGTEGGKVNFSEGKLEFLWEYNTLEQKKLGQLSTEDFALENDKLKILQREWKRIDDGTPGQLQGVWLITGRKQNGQMNTHTPGARKTMKILSGTRFQWIAYNSDTGEFFGTGGGTYTTKNGRYTEHILFFSRDNSRVGASLAFNYELKDDQWHHSGYSSKGDPLYEIWTRRQKLGI